MATTVNNRLYNTMSQNAKSENMMDRLQLAEFAACKTYYKPVEEIGLIPVTMHSSCFFYLYGG